LQICKFAYHSLVKHDMCIIMLKFRAAIYLGWSFVLLAASGSLSLDAGSSEAGTCKSNSCRFSAADDGTEADGTLSLLQVATTALRSMPSEVAHTPDNITGGVSSDVEGASDHERHPLVLAEKENDLRHGGKFPAPTSGPEVVEQFLLKLGHAAAAGMMKQSNINGDAFIRMSREDLLRYGISEEDVEHLLPRLRTAQAQWNIRKKIEHFTDTGTIFQARSALHDVVGDDGVLMISLDRVSERFDHSSKALEQIGIHVKKISAVDASSATPQELGQGCPKAGVEGVREWCDGPEQFRSGHGCSWETEQAVAASHRKALEFAKKRAPPENGGKEWTAILEDDAVPAPIEHWDLAFRDAWAELPERVKFVRLGWCQAGQMNWKYPMRQVPFSNSSNSVLVEQWDFGGEMLYDPGGCTTAYMVHKDILDEVLNLFPCCGPVDSCYKWDFFKRVDPDTNKFHGLHAMLSLDSHSEPLWDDWYLEHHGLFFQDRGKLDRTQVLHR